MRIDRRASNVAALGFLVMAALLATASPSRAAFKVLYSFCPQDYCPDGAEPEGGLILDGAGNLFGTAADDGTYAGGTLYRLSPDGQDWTYAKLYDFCTNYSEDCTDGAAPTGSLVMDTSGNLYGVTRDGGGYHHAVINAGTAYEIGYDAGTGTWIEKHVHDFCGEDCTRRGDEPFAGLTYAGAASGALYDGVSPLYGLTLSGGKFSGGTGSGVAFELVPVEGKEKWDIGVIHDFCQKQSCIDGTGSAAPLLSDGTGNLIGTSPYGGPTGAGLVYSLSPTGGKKWKQTVLWSFCQKDGCRDGSGPQSGVIADAGGALYGMTTGGGGPNCYSSCGTVFKLTSGGQLGVLHKFCNEFDCRDGNAPASAGLIMDAQGNLYGTTPYGGETFYDQMGGGVVFEITAAGKFKVLHRFCAKAGCLDGDRPSGNLTLDSSGRLFGVTNAGGARAHGTIYEIAR